MLLYVAFCQPMGSWSGSSPKILDSIAPYRSTKTGLNTAHLNSFKDSKALRIALKIIHKAFAYEGPSSCRIWDCIHAVDMAL